MTINGKNIGFAFTASHCTYEDVWPQINRLASAGANVYPIVSENVAGTDTRFGRGQEIVEKFAALAKRSVIQEIAQAEPIGPEKLLDCLLIAPCTGNTCAKLANAITDTAVTMAAKAHLRNSRPLVLAISTNDALGLNAKNIGVLLNTPYVFFVPFGQDNPGEKPNSVVADMELILPTLEKALENRQLQPLLIERKWRRVH